ncbi:TylF/MycF/NovP-related O-methyltransferase [Blastomonas sp.]|uniref:TylF/MycF/NovP-related O-methyltransferase n=1 Tax=Blastomonas sp. TaxID=1909299 RepID=UPI0026323EE8|nr:TylF/MycF/NovP-related O-methyltransferase [Blastomonas sp.]MDM7955558.1 TylF/MycF/NovP-related O-methyltransferase [Blastomonas sp.]
MAEPSVQFDREAYVDLLKRSITNFHYLGDDASFEQFRCVSHYDLDTGEWKIDRAALPATLLRKGQLDLIEQAVVWIEANQVPGDYIEAGVWRGGVIILLRALLGAYAIPERKVFAADSFAGIPLNVRAVNDPVDLWTDRWVAGLDEVKKNIERFGMMDDRIRFVPGFFADTLHALGNERFSLIRLDSDSYDSVETSLEYLYPLLSDGGVMIIDDWHLPGCRMAVMDYRAHFGITDPIYEHDANAYWTKKGLAPLPGLG